MKLSKFVFVAALLICSYFVSAAGSDYQISSVSCTQIDPTHLHLTCKMSDQSDLNGDLINYDVKDSSGTIIGSGKGSTVFVDNTKLASEEDYTIVVTAIVNGIAVSQSVSRKMPKK